VPNMLHSCQPGVCLCVFLSVCLSWFALLWFSFACVAVVQTSLAPINIFSEPRIASNAFHKRNMTLQVGEIVCASKCVCCAHLTHLFPPARLSCTGDKGIHVLKSKARNQTRAATRLHKLAGMPRSSCSGILGMHFKASSARSLRPHELVA
jgi:hypothetical protein